MRSRLLVPLLLLLLVGCVANPVGPRPEAQRLRGQVVRLDRPEHARIEVYRMTDHGIAERRHGADVTPASDGSFTTTPLLPGRYLLALRTADRPVSIITLPVPPAPTARLVARKPLGAAALELRQDIPDVDQLDILLTTIEQGVPVTDRRTVAVRSGITALVRGLSPGRWRLDVVGTGATTNLQVPDSAETLAVTLSPPPVAGGAQFMGRVLRLDGEPAVGVAVTLHPMTGADGEPAAWGRYALTDSDGGYRLAGLAAGPALLRLESRDAVHRRLPMPERVTIPPSGVVRRSFVIEP